MSISYNITILGNNNSRTASRHNIRFLCFICIYFHHLRSYYLNKSFDCISSGFISKLLIICLRLVFCPQNNISSLKFRFKSCEVSAVYIRNYTVNGQNAHNNKNHSQKYRRCRNTAFFLIRYRLISDIIENIIFNNIKTFTLFCSCTAIIVIFKIIVHFFLHLSVYSHCLHYLRIPLPGQR